MVETDQSGRQTKVTSEGGRDGIWSPFSVEDRVVWLNIWTKFEVTFGKLVVTTLGSGDGVLPLLEQLVPLVNCVEERLEPRVELEDRFWVESICGHGVIDGRGPRTGEKNESGHRF